MATPEHVDPLDEASYAATFAALSSSTSEYEGMLELAVAAARRRLGAGPLRVLSVGAGTGHFDSLLLARLAAQGVAIARYVAVEPNPAHVAQLRARFDAPSFSADVAEVHVHEGPFSPRFDLQERYDLIVFAHSMYVLPERSKALARAVELLRRGGAIWVFNQSETGYYDLYHRFCGRLRFTSPPLAEHGIGPREVAECLAGVGGLEVVIDERPSWVDATPLFAELDADAPFRVEALAPTARATLDGLLSFCLQTDVARLSAGLRSEMAETFYRMCRREDGAIRFDHPSVLISATADAYQYSDQQWGYVHTSEGRGVEWKRDVSEMFDTLEHAERAHRDPANIDSLAVHRWLGPERSTEEHYRLIHGALAGLQGRAARVLDAGCGLGAGLMWFAEREPLWDLVGCTLSSAQVGFVEAQLPERRFEITLSSFDDIEEEYDAIYAIESIVQSDDLEATLRAWAAHLRPGGRVVIIDDFIASEGVDDRRALELFRRAWMLPSLATVERYLAAAAAAGLELVTERDLVDEYEVVRLNYGGELPPMPEEASFDGHQSFFGAQIRGRLTVSGQLLYRMLVFRAPAGSEQTRD